MDSGENNLEVYRQRYETFRHLDGLRWQILQSAVASVGIVLALGKGAFETGSAWIWLAVGIIFLALGSAMFRVNGGVAANSVVLREVGLKVGDEGIPIKVKWWHGIAVWISMIMIALGIATLAMFAKTQI